MDEGSGSASRQCSEGRSVGRRGSLGAEILGIVEREAAGGRLGIGDPVTEEMVRTVEPGSAGGIFIADHVHQAVGGSFEEAASRSTIPVTEEMVRTVEPGSAGGIFIGNHVHQAVGGSFEEADKSGGFVISDELAACDRPIISVLLCEKSSVPDLETVESGSTSMGHSYGTMSTEMLGTIERKDVGRRLFGKIRSDEEREAERNHKISAVVFREGTSTIEIGRASIAPHYPAAFCHNRLLTEEEEIAALIEVKEEEPADKTVSTDSPLPCMGKKLDVDLVKAPADKTVSTGSPLPCTGKKVKPPTDTKLSTYSPLPRMRKTLGVHPNVWQGVFTIPEVALSGNQQIDRVNSVIAEAYNNISMVLRTKHLSALFSKVKNGHLDEISNEAVKACVGDIRTHCRHLRQEVLALGGTPISEPVKYWREKYPLASF